MPNNRRILFTGDWHIGADTWGRDRRDELKEAVTGLAGVVEQRNVSSVVVLGDVFDSFRWPGREDLEFAASLFGILCAAPSVERLVLVKGNHDWNDVAAWPKMIFNSGERPKFTVHETPSFVRADGGFICVVPHLRKHAVGNGLPATIRRAVPAEDGPSIVCAHMAFEGTTPSIPDGEPVMTGEALSMWGKRLKGAVFGHIHSSLDFRCGETPCFYASTPIRITFAEEKNRPGALLGGFDGMFERVFTEARELVTVRAKTMRDAAAEIENLQNSTDGGSVPYIRVVVDEAMPGAVSGKRGNAMEGLVDGEALKNVVSVSVSSGVDESADISPTDSNGNIVRPEAPSVRGMLRPFIEENLPGSMDGEFFVSVAEALLSGESPSNIWLGMKSSSFSAFAGHGNVHEDERASVEESAYGEASL